jgi:IS1 family transposase
MTGVAKGTVLKLLVDLGQACSEYQARTLVNLRCKRIQCDEIWSFCYAKQKNIPASKKGQRGIGDVWTWTGMDADSKLMVSWLVGERNAPCARAFVQDLSERLASRVQLTTDGLNLYLDAVEEAFGADVDYAMLVKLYGDAPEAEKRYSPPVCTGARKTLVNGCPREDQVSTSYIERQNLTMRMSMRRFTRLTNGFSKKAQNLAAAVSLHFMHYNFVRIHQTLRCTPAMAAGVSKRLWEIEDIVALIDQKSN